MLPFLVDVLWSLKMLGIAGHFGEAGTDFFVDRLVEDARQLAETRLVQRIRLACEKNSRF